jgi:hypothetical protein
LVEQDPSAVELADGKVKWAWAGLRPGADAGTFAS